jgi:hypothetical protein
MLTEEELAIIQSLRNDVQRAKDVAERYRSEAEALKNENTLIRWMVRGIAAERAHFTVTLQERMVSKDLLRAAEVFGYNAAIKLLDLGKIAFKDHARMYTMRRYIQYLQNHASNHGLEFTELGENNEGRNDIFNDKWEPWSLYGDYITSNAGKTGTIK